MITLPIRIREALEKDQLLFGETNATLATFTPWFADNKLIFFPEYTDHGINHLQEVLNTAASIITDESWELISPQDAAALVIASLLHDCAMHLSEDGFYVLISDKYPLLTSRYDSQDISWKEKWLAFLAEARRWDGKKLKMLFDDNIPVRNIPDNKNDLTRRDRLLIGEFLRREHANLAHSIALLGVPQIGNHALTVKISDSKFCDLIGFIAKSHNMSLRMATDKLGASQKRSAFNIHAPYIMGILRISDYIQVHSSRAEKQLLSVKSLTSPISRGEWEKHNSILDINQTHEDPEALYVDAEPQTPITFKHLKLLFKDIQRELDSTWSVIGEVYGRFQPYSKFGINIRRLRSSLDDENKYILEKRPSFIPQPLKFKTSDAEMISLLVAPLYGNNPAIGIRELVQNSVDACNERIDFYDKTGNIDYNKNDINVIVRLDVKPDNKATLCIIDTGIGMNINIIENYFLNIGASFRNSDKWKEMHETNGHSNVHRTGRFGIGLLAAFLLGKEIEVETRHLTEKRGLRFKCSQDSDDISVTPTECAIGTKITISLSEEVSKQLIGENVEKNRDWYCLSFPKVNRIININNIDHFLDQKTTVPNSGDDITDTNWCRIEHDDFDDILWSPSSKERLSQITCNGITLAQRGVYYKPKTNNSWFDIECMKPNLVVFDQDGVMPINLTRDGLTSDELPFNDELVTSISLKLAQEIHDEFYAKDFELTDNLVNKLIHHKLKYADSSNYISESVSDFLFYNKKVYPSNRSIVHQLQPPMLFIDAVSDLDSINGGSLFNILSPEGLYSFYNISRRSKSSKTQFIRALFDRGVYAKTFPYSGKRLFIKKEEINDILKPGYLPKSIWSRLSVEWSDDVWAIMKIGIVPEMTFIPEELFSQNKSKQSMFACLYVDWSEEDKQPPRSIFNEVWNDLISINNK